MTNWHWRSCAQEILWLSVQIRQTRFGKQGKIPLEGGVLHLATEIASSVKR